MLRAIKSQRIVMREVVVMSPVESSKSLSQSDDGVGISNGHADNTLKVLCIPKTYMFVEIWFLVGGIFYFNTYSFTVTRISGNSYSLLARCPRL